MNYKEIAAIKKDNSYKQTEVYTVKAKDKEVYTVTASTPEMDRDGEIILPSAFKASLPAYLEKNPIILFNHNMFEKPVARAVSGRVDSTFELDIKFASTDAAQEIKTLVDEGILNTVSIGGLVKDWEYNGDGVKVIKDLELWEVSIVTIPSNRSALIQRMKAAGVMNIENYFDNSDEPESNASTPEVASVKRPNSMKDGIMRIANIKI